MSTKPSEGAVKSNGSASNAIPLSIENMENEIQRLQSINNELESNCRDLRVAYEQNASQCVQLNRELAMKPDTVEWLNGVTIQRQRAEQAEAHIAKLVAALEKIAKSDPLANGRYAAHNAAQALARAESATPAKHGGSAH